MYDKTEVKIIEQVYLNPGIHKRELSKNLKLGMPSIEYALRKVENLLREQKSGNQIKYFLNYSRKALTPMLYAIEFSRLERLPSKIRLSIQDFLEEAEIKPLIVILFGSYAKGNYTKESDIDVLLVFQKLEKENDRDIENIAKRISMRTNTKISPVYLEYSIFRESFHNPRKEFFKNLKENKIILVGIEYWRELKNEEA
ncbi:MAG: nucleotidyltransferase domain-containing protein [Nanoarchaeota archaeon]|nr:nucleotidyltransferase domain-containing protein [Nanoarchaeota archaeon]